MEDNTVYAMLAIMGIAPISCIFMCLVFQLWEDNTFDLNLMMKDYIRNPILIFLIALILYYHIRDDTILTIDVVVTLIYIYRLNPFNMDKYYKRRRFK